MLSSKRVPRWRFFISTRSASPSVAIPRADLALVNIGETKTQSIRLRILNKEIAAGGEEHAALAHVDQQFARVKTGNEFHPHSHSAGGMRPASSGRHETRKSGFYDSQFLCVNLAHFRDVASEQSAASEFGEHGLRELIGVEIGGLLHETKTLDHIWRRDYPTDAQPGKSNFGKTINLDYEICAVELA